MPRKEDYIHTWGGEGATLDVAVALEESPRMGSGACSRCTAEISGGQRSKDKQCYRFNAAYEGGSVCMTCGHSWYDHA
jgi:hypothetical protein